MMGVNAGYPTFFDVFDERANFEYKFCAWPRKCHNTGKWLFMVTAMRGRRIIMGPGDDVIEDRWYTKDEGIIMMLKKGLR